MLDSSLLDSPATEGRESELAELQRRSQETDTMLSAVSIVRSNLLVATAPW